jgi:hypothetical protein
VYAALKESGVDFQAVNYFTDPIPRSKLTELLRNFGEWRRMIYSCALILILFFLPGGLVAPMWRRLRAAWSGRA